MRPLEGFLSDGRKEEYAAFCDRLGVPEHPGFTSYTRPASFGAHIGIITYTAKEKGPFNLDPKGKENAFEPILAKYLKIGETLIGLASASIVLLVGSSAFHSQGGKLPSFYASPLYLLAACIMYGICFSVWLTFNYENYQHGNPHTRFAYSLSETLGFSSIMCFFIGYVWLIVQVTH